METYKAEIKKYLDTAAADMFETDCFDDDRVLLPLDDALKTTCGDPPMFTETAWKCSICLGLPREPVVIGKCGHMACEKCIMHALTLDRTRIQIGPEGSCPVCRGPYTVNTMLEYKNWPLLMRQIWSTIKVRCKKCDYFNDPISVVKHERTQCEDRHVCCPGCWIGGTPSYTYVHAISCKDVMVYCLDCGYPIKLVDKENHQCSKCLFELRRSQENSDVQRIQYKMIKPGKKGAVALNVATSIDMWLRMENLPHDEWSFSPNPSMREAAEEIAAEIRNAQTARNAAQGSARGLPRGRRAAP